LKEEDLLKAWEGARQESAAASVMTVCILKINRRATSYRNQVIGDSYGKACHLSERDCSVQSRHQN
jgi:acetyl-CoA carboxylase biotin carboxylase subunit